MDKIWLKSYPKGVPAEINLDRELPNIRLERSGSTPAAQPER